MVRIDDLALFVRSAALGSFSNAAREVDLLPAQVSAAIKRLERELNIRLFARSTRSLRLTAEGEQYLPYACKVLQTLREGRDLLHQEPTGLHGLLQIAAPSDLGRNLLLPWITEFRHDHPNLQVRLYLSDQVADVFKDPVDVAFRYGVMDDASYVALPLAADNHRVVVASPEYLARHGRPRTPADLAGHDCLTFVLRGRVYDKWRFYLDGQRQVVGVSGSLTSDDAEVVRRLAIAGEGIAYKSWLDVCRDVRAGSLEVILKPYRGDLIPLHLICPHRKQFSPAIRQLYERLKTRCEDLQQDYIDQFDRPGRAG
ncbi:LysR family transcriptional regulator [Acerihabitans arboris]|uniref:LysR family transcriptional regulator n=1 Tax=Acerihabitans arboris TaxID=2691583 RepID=A0A845SNF0_9GAMM|nr:LysR family transcriptional regulator [Acerihabitans arboris]NDL64068.1 LysR family transcriptional regulator [Acerihabitans arboris]